MEADQRQHGNPPASPGWYGEGKDRRFWNGSNWGEHWGSQDQPGWYPTDGTLRYFDGESWTDQVAPPYPKNLSTAGIAGSVMIGILGAFLLLWLGAQIAPEHIYLPVKFVVKELPNVSSP